MMSTNSIGLHWSRNINKIIVSMKNVQLCFRDVSIEKEVSVSVMEDARPIYADNSFLYNSYIYFGNSTILRVKMGRRLNYITH